MHCHPAEDCCHPGKFTAMPETTPMHMMIEFLSQHWQHSQSDAY
jgi:hypothetical protein